MRRLTMKFGVLSIVLFMLLSQGRLSGALAQSSAPEITFPDLTGPYKVGRTSFEWLDQSRDDVSASIPGLKRDLMVYVWFPTTPAKRTKIAPYMDGDLLWDLSFRKHPGLEGTVHIHAYSTSILNTDKPSYPVLIFDPNFRQSSLKYASIIEDIASHGYIVIGMTHPYSTEAVEYPDGRLVVYGHGPLVATEDTISAIEELVYRDDLFALNQLEKLNQAEGSFKGHLDLDHIGMFGHEFGAEFTMDVAADDPRIKAAVSIYGATDADPEMKPFLIVGPSGVSFKHNQDKFRLLIDGTSTANFGDFGLLEPILQAGAALGSIEPAQGIHIVNDYLVAFFDHYLKGASLKWPTYGETHLIPIGSPAN